MMNATFAGLLDVAYRYGGGLLKFGGDALLLFYDGDDHAARAATAAFRMRALLKQIGRPATLGGRVTLRMHVGIHSGPFEFFLVGSSHRELVVAGPAATRTVEMEGLAAADEILLSDEAAALVSSRLLGDARPDGSRLLRGDPKAPALRGAAPRREPTRPRGCSSPPMVRESRRRAPSRPSTATPASRSSTSAAPTRPSSRTRRLPSAAVEQVVRGRAGRGRPLRRLLPRDRHRCRRRQDRPRRRRSRGVRERRGARCFARFATSFDDSLPLPLRAGVNRGRVFAGEVGAPFRRTYTILGDTAALAARLMARALPSQVLATSAVLERSRTTFAVKSSPGSCRRASPRRSCRSPWATWRARRSPRPRARRSSAGRASWRCSSRRSGRSGWASGRSSSSWATQGSGSRGCSRSCAPTRRG